MIDRKQICWTILLIPIFLLFGGCSAGFESSTTYDATTGKRTVVNYAPTYKSSITNICDELRFKVTGFNTKKINPITYPILRALGALGPDDMEFTMSTVVHVKNVSDKPCKLEFISIRFNSDEIKKITPQTCELAPNVATSTAEIFGKCSKWAADTEKITVHLNFTVNNKVYSDVPIVLHRETIEEMKERLKNS